jgi:hypothetical protein
MGTIENWLSFTTFVIISLLVGCGGNSKQKIDIAVTPSATSIAIWESVNLQATGSSLIQGTNVDWVVEQDPSCTVIAKTFPSDEPSPCPFGWLWEPTPTGKLPATSVTYAAPQTVGTYHVVAKERLQTGETGQSVATITVTLHKVDISVTPATATIPINSSVDLQAVGSSVTKYTNIYWYVEEEAGSSCTTESLPPQAPSGPCPSGWVWEEESIDSSPRIQATYYSPSTPGTYHVVAFAQLLTNETGQSVATITVTP